MIGARIPSRYSWCLNVSHVMVAIRSPFASFRNTGGIASGKCLATAPQIARSKFAGETPGRRLRMSPELFIFLRSINCCRYALGNRANSRIAAQVWWSSSEHTTSGPRVSSSCTRLLNTEKPRRHLCSSVPPCVMSVSWPIAADGRSVSKLPFAA